MTVGIDLYVPNPSSPSVPVSMSSVGAPATVPLTITGDTAQTADLLDITQSGGGAGGLFKVDSAGNLTCQNIKSLTNNIQNSSNGVALKVAGGGSDVNQVTISSATAGNTPIITATGSDAQVNLAIRPTGSAGVVGIQNPSGVSILRAVSVASAANGVTVTQSAAASAPAIAASGTDTNIALNLQSKGAQTVYFTTNGATAFEIGQVASAANYVNTTPAAAAASPVVQAKGSDTNIDLTLAGKGTGIINVGYAGSATGGNATPTFGANFTGGGAAPQTAAQNGWLAVKVNGTTSYVPFWR